MIPAVIPHRRARAQTVIDTYNCFEKYPDRHEAVIDILADLMHWTDGKALDFQKALDIAHFHHDAEVQP